MDTTSMELLLIQVGDLRCGLAIEAVQEISKNKTVTPVWGAPDFVRGVINLRGRIVTIIDLARRLGISSQGDSEGQKNIVIRSGGELIGLMVDDVDDIVTVPAGGIQASPAHAMGAMKEFLVGVLPLEDDLAGILDVDRLVR